MDMLQTLSGYQNQLQKSFNQSISGLQSNFNQTAQWVEKELNELIAEYGKSLDGAQSWVKSFIYGEFNTDERPVSVIVTEMLAGFVPGTVLVFSARDAIAVIMRMLNDPKKQDEVQEWMLLAVYLLPFVLVGATAATGAATGGAGGAFFGGVGAAPGAGAGGILGGAVGSEIGNVVKCVGLFLIKRTPHLATIISKLNGFMKGNVVPTLKKIKYSDYASAVTNIITSILNQLLGLVKRVKSLLSYGAKINWMGLGWAKSIYLRMERFEAVLISMIQKSAIKIKQGFKEFDEHLQDLLKQSVKYEPAYATVGTKVKPVPTPTQTVRPSYPQTAKANVVHTAAASNKSASGTKTPENVHQPKVKEPITKKMPETKVKCFNPVNTSSARKNADKMIKENYPKDSNSLAVEEYLNKETDWQLANQQKGLNEMSVEDYIQGRKAFDTEGRGGGAPAEQARKKYGADLAEKYEKEYQQQNIGAREAKKLAKEKSGRIMNEMAALHNPDQLVGGANKVDTKAIGLKNVNSSIGSQWKTRVQALDEAAAKVPVSERGTTGMNAKLERCKK
ncbi:hypothetical protein F971_00411 [Acinetobacter vivianii]|uniref:Uncharacterized protein n=1 Tax=Acinetobacter vivianii TaxID=1776742 RepID=N8WAQ7_9GAMM|nr:polymorphic toxin type 15 domain-containing protein [Acinetobacter vivianii]ENU93973.1 hypothetical protein F971_00411 [Acinetobacter vivianii]